MTQRGGLKEVIPRSGLVLEELKLYPVLCKPRLMALKSVTLEKLERMQAEAAEKMWEAEGEELREPRGGDQRSPTPPPEPHRHTGHPDDPQPPPYQPQATPDVWNPDDEPQEEEKEEA